MERVSETTQANIRPLGELLSPRCDATTASASAMDPAQTFEQERIRQFEAAWNEGYASGMTEAGEQIETRAKAAEAQWTAKYAHEVERMRAASAALDTLGAHLGDAIAELERQIEPLVIETVCAAVARIIGTAIVDDALALALCRQALDEYTARPLVLRVAKTDFETVSAAIRLPQVRIETDPALARGACRLESAKGLYEVSIDARWASFLQALAEDTDIADGCL